MCYFGCICWKKITTRPRDDVSKLFLLVSRNIQDVLSNFKSRLAYFSRPFFSFPFSCPLFLSLDLHGVWRWYNCNKELPIIQSRERSEIYCRFVCIHIEWPKKDLQSNKSTFWTMIYPSHIMTTSCFLQLTRFYWHFERTLVFRTHLNRPPLDGPKFPDMIFHFSPQDLMKEQERYGALEDGRCWRLAFWDGTDFPPSDRWIQMGSLNDGEEITTSLERIFGRFGDAMTIQIPIYSSARVLSKPHGRLQLDHVHDVLPKL